MGRPAEYGGELTAIQSLRISAEIGFHGVPNPPGWMGNPVLDGAAAGLSAIAPVMFRNELVERALRDLAGLAGGVDGQAVPVARQPPRIFDAQGGALARKLVRHRQTAVILAIDPAGDGRDRAPGNDLLNENDAALHGTGFAPANVESEVHLVKIAVERNGNSVHLRVKKAETDQADEGPAVKRVEFGSRRNARREQRGVDLEIQNREIPPLGGEEDVPVSARYLPGYARRPRLVSSRALPFP